MSISMVYRTFYTIKCLRQLMDITTVKILNSLNSSFYQKNYASFSATRQTPWDGWYRCLALLEDAGFTPRNNLSVFDLACGNLRFETFLKAELPETVIDYYAVDNCDELLPANSSVHYQSLDILEMLLSTQNINQQFNAPSCDLSVSFGFMHHIPLQEKRRETLLSLIRQTRAGGYVVISFWQFLRNKAMRNKAELTHAQALEELGIVNLDNNDYLLGWKDLPGEYRYCHSFTDNEIDQLVEAADTNTTLVSRFFSDGRSNNLNDYLILRVR